MPPGMAVFSVCAQIFPAPLSSFLAPWMGVHVCRTANVVMNAMMVVMGSACSSNLVLSLSFCVHTQPHVGQDQGSVKMLGNWGLSLHPGQGQHW